MKEKDMLGWSKMSKLFPIAKLRYLNQHLRFFSGGYVPPKMVTGSCIWQGIGGDDFGLWCKNNGGGRPL